MVKVYQRIKKIINIVSFIAFSLTFLFGILVIISMVQATKFNKPAWIFGYQYSIVASPSMEPELATGDIIIVKAVKLEDIKINDWIVFYSATEKKYIVHAVNRIEDGKYYTKGLNNPSEDKGYVDESNFEGKVVFDIPFGHIGIYAINNRSTILLTVMLFLTVIILINAYDIYRLLMKREKEAIESEKQNFEDELRLEIQKELEEELKKQKE